MKRTFATLIALTLLLSASAQGVWQSDLGNGRYKNPVLHADYSDPDVIRVGDDYWMTSSSFACTPGLQILHSTDLVNWAIAGTALPRMYDEAFDVPSHGNGVWAPAIRHHEGTFYIYWGDPDRGIYMVSATDPRGEWSQPHLVKAARGIIDTCPFWDEDGRAYLVHGWAGSRAGFKSVLSISEMTPDGRALIGEEVLIFDGHDEHPTVEGPKMHRRGDFYYIFAPAGGAKPGRQLVLRSRSPWGPYECRKVLHQGNTSTPGPHQGAWVEDVEGASWFLHFVDMYAYGRVVHLQPMTWSSDGWCTIGVDQNGDGVGEPVESWKKPASRVAAELKTPAESDEFDTRTLGLQWQWAATPQSGWYFTNPSAGELRMNCVQGELRNLTDAPNLLLQKIAAPDATYTAKLRFSPSYEGDRAGITVMGYDYARLGVLLRDGRVVVEQCRAEQAMKRHTEEQIVAEREIAASAEPVDVWLRCRVCRKWNDDGTPRMECRFAYSLDGRRYHDFGEMFIATAGWWIGAKTGLYATADIRKNDGGRVDVDWFRVER